MKRSANRSLRKVHLKAILLSGFVAIAAAATAAAQPAPPAATSKPMRLLSTAFLVSDIDRSLVFYTKGLGLTAPVRLNHVGAVEAPLVLPGGGPTLLLEQHKAPPPGEMVGQGHVVFEVSDLHAVESRLVAAGYALAVPITERPKEHVLIAKVKDPDGNQVELVQRPQ